MKIELSRICAAIAFSAIAGAAAAQPATPVGLWRNIDDETGKPKALVRITEVGGALFGRIEQVLTPGKEEATCEKCEGELKDKPVRGLQILQGLRRAGDWYEGGTILDPNNGKVYKSQVKLLDGGTKLEVRGFVGLPLLGRSQTWIRER